MTTVMVRTSGETVMLSLSRPVSTGQYTRARPRTWMPMSRSLPKNRARTWRDAASPDHRKKCPAMPWCGPSGHRPGVVRPGHLVGERDHQVAAAAAHVVDHLAAQPGGAGGGPGGLL